MGTKGGKKLHKKMEGEEGGGNIRETVLAACGHLRSKVRKDEEWQPFPKSAFLPGSGIPARPCFTLETVFVQLQPRFTAFSGFTPAGAGGGLCAVCTRAPDLWSCWFNVLLIHLLHSHLFPQGGVCKRHSRLVTNKL